jgi:hypothetical protein
VNVPFHQLPVGYAGQRYRADAITYEGDVVQLGWSDDPECKGFARHVELNPGLERLVVVDLSLCAD